MLNYNLMAIEKICEYQTDWMETFIEKQGFEFLTSLYLNFEVQFLTSLTKILISFSWNNLIEEKDTNLIITNCLKILEKFLQEGCNEIEIIKLSFQLVVQTLNNNKNILESILWESRTVINAGMPIIKRNFQC